MYQNNRRKIPLLETEFKNLSGIAKDGSTEIEISGDILMKNASPFFSGKFENSIHYTII